MSGSLRSLSDHDILTRTHDLVVKERGVTLTVLLHLNEIERRHLHLKRGHRSMFDYCTAGLGYSASAASRRIRTARCVARFPELYSLLQANEVNLSTVSQVSKILTAQNARDVFASIRGKSQKDVEAIVAEYEPRTAVPPDRVKTIVIVAKRANEAIEAQRGLSDTIATASVGSDVQLAANKYDRCGCNSDNVSDAGNGVRVERRAMIQFSASEAFMEKVQRVRALASHRLPANAPLEQVFELALDLFIAKEDPAARQERRDSRKTAAARETDSSRSPRSIPAPVRDAVFLRDQQRCTYKAPDGKPC